MSFPQPLLPNIFPTLKWQLSPSSGSEQSSGRSSLFCLSCPHLAHLQLWWGLSLGSTQNLSTSHHLHHSAPSQQHLFHIIAIITGRPVSTLSPCVSYTEPFTRKSYPITPLLKTLQGRSLGEKTRVFLTTFMEKHDPTPPALTSLSLSLSPLTRSTPAMLPCIYLNTAGTHLPHSLSPAAPFALSALPDIQPQGPLPHLLHIFGRVTFWETPLLSLHCRSQPPAPLCDCFLRALSASDMCI